ncbi:MAG TPA: hypothetical protein VGS97_14255 [Actinocrinis sp.]|uniref:hypothetical protein n=1 Tax=Actinocrinis sp. TaxID=1920516 RepID=UPI002DDD02EB|nr:hypothetical protein [Actinocrinis sp.]HEV2345257.1 hypothetical protein [Actinocrinis sp.]
MDRDQNQGSIRTLVRRLLLTAGSGAAAVAAALAAGDRDTASVATIATVLAAIALAGDFLHEVAQRLRRLEQRAGETLDQAAGMLEAATAQIRADVDRRFAQLTTVPEAFGLQPLDHTRAAELIKVVQNAYAFEHRSSPLANAFVQAEAQRFNLLLHQLRAGEGTYDGEDRDWLLTLTQASTRTLDATSLTTTDAGGRLRFSGGFWDSDLGLHYLELQAEAVRRGMVIRRVFILENAKVTEDPAYQAMCERQRRLGFEIRYLVPDMVSVNLHNKLDDFIVFDNEISYEVVASLAPGNVRPVISSTHLVLNRMLVAKRVRQFAEIWDAALPCADPDEQLD